MASEDEVYDLDTSTAAACAVEEAPLVPAPLVPALVYKHEHKTQRRLPFDLALKPDVVVHVVVLLAALLWLATGVDAFLVVMACLLIAILCCLPQVLWCRIVDWVALALIIVLLVYRDYSQIWEDVMLVIFRVHNNATATR